MNKSLKKNKKSSFLSRYNKYSNPCVRCGKQRIDVKSWEENVVNYSGTSVVICTETVCPDPECQKIVEKDIALLKKKREEMEQNKLQRRAAAKH